MSGMFYNGHTFNTMDTSVDDAMQSVRKSTSLTDLRDWLKHERDGRKRKTIVNGITSRIRKLEKIL